MIKKHEKWRISLCNFGGFHGKSPSRRFLGDFLGKKNPSGSSKKAMENG